MDVYDEVDRRENDAGERGHGEQPGVAAGCPPPFGAGGRPGSGRSRQRGGGDPAPQAPPSSFLRPGPGAVSSTQGAAATPRDVGVPEVGAGCVPPPKLWGWGTSPGLILWGAPGPQGRVPGGDPFPGKGREQWACQNCSTLGWGGHGAVPQRGLGVLGVWSPPLQAEGVAGGGDSVSTAGLRSQPQHAGPEPAPASCRPHGLPGVGTAPLGPPTHTATPWGGGRNPPP